MNSKTIVASPAAQGLRLDFIADLVCPWSFVGKRGLEQALQSLWAATPQQLRWHGLRPQPFETLTANLSWSSYFAMRLAPVSNADYAQQQLLDIGRRLGICFNFADIGRVPDTQQAHRLVSIAAAEQRQSELTDAIFSAFFEKGQDIADRNVLVGLADLTGLSTASITSFVESDKDLDIVLAEEKRLVALGVAATPNLLINGQVLVPGAADVSTYVKALDHALFPGLVQAEEPKKIH
jgi:predicted DsbA family dithiol-disulfide isomerase